MKKIYKINKNILYIFMQEFVLQKKKNYQLIEYLTSIFFFKELDEMLELNKFETQRIQLNKNKIRRLK